MKHFIINIGCEYGSGGPDIGKMVAESLGIPFYDRDLVDQVVEKLGVDRDLVEKADSGEENVKYEFDTNLWTKDMRILQTVLFTHSLRLFINWRQNHLVSLSEDVVTIY